MPANLTGRLLLATCASLIPLAVAAQPVSSGGGGGGGGASSVLVVATTAPVPLTGTTTETNLAALRIPGGSMGAGGTINLQCFWTYPNSANAKTLQYRFTSTPGSTSGGQMGSPPSPTTTTNTQTLHIVHNTAVNAQLVSPGQPTAPFGSLAAAAFPNSIDTSADSFINVNGQLASAAETLTLQHCVALVLRAP
jgi:hypothetical protein